MSGHQDRVHLLAFYLRQQRVEVRCVGAVAFVHRDMQPGRFQHGACALGNRYVERIVRVQQRNAGRHRLERLEHFDRAAEVIAGGRQGAEYVLELARKDLVRRAAALDHGHLVLFRYGGIGQREVAGEGA
ncbi:hypothetical protein D9M68_875380 [compost metagenome]